MKNKNSLLILLLLVFAFKISVAQQSNLLYFMDGVPQSNYLNPAKQAPSNLHIGIPLLNIQAYGGNSALAYKDIYIPSDTSNSLNWAIHNQPDRNIFMKNFHKVNYLSSSVQTHIISFGYRSNFDPDVYINFDYSMKAEAIFSYTDDFMDLLIKQDFAPQDVSQSWKKTGLNLLAYNELAVGVSKVIDNQLTVGIRPKLLFGKANAVVKFKEFDKYTSMSEWDFNTDIRAHISMPNFVNVDSLVSSIFDSTLSYNPSFSTNDLVHSIISPYNFGLGIDIGAVYTPMDELELSASILDLGFIRWGNNTYSAKTNGKYAFIGQEITSLKQVMNDSTTKLTAGLIDTLIDVFGPEENYDPYWQALSGKLYLGARYYVNPKISLGVLSVSRLYQGRIRQSATLSSNFYVARNFSASLAYSMSNYTFDNLGFGLNLGLWPLNMYIIVDKIPILFSKNMTPIYMQYANIRFGLNFILGCGKKIKDVPMIE